MAVGRSMRTSFKWLCKNHKGEMICHICNLPTTKDDRNCDHLIPVSLCWILGMYEMLWEPRNMRVAHPSCNSYRSNDVSILPVKAQQHLLNALKKIELDEDETEIVRAAFRIPPHVSIAEFELP